MNPHILTSEVQDFIDQHLKIDITKMAFKGSPFKDISIQELMHQIISKNKCQEKLPTWFKTSFIYYPPKLNIEQTSSEKTAQYKASLINGNSIIDLTGGLGVDSFYFSKVFDKVTHCEIDNQLSEIAAYNFKQLQATNINCIHEDGISYLQNTTQKFDWIYIDPSRRDQIKGKVFRLTDCIPNVPIHLATLFEHTNRVLIKAAPLLDLSIAIHELQYVTAVHIVAVDNEVKEILFILMKNNSDTIIIKTINILNTCSQTFDFIWDESKRVVQYAAPLKYLYEPNKAILKSGCFNLLADEFKLYKIAQNTHLYTSDTLIDFPGTTYEVLEQLPYHAKKLKSVLPHLQANIKIRNFTEPINTIKKKMNLKDGGQFYVFFTTDTNEKPMVLVTKKVEF